MNTTEQRIAIAEACGWRIVPTNKYAWVVICPANMERAWSSQAGDLNDKPASYYLPDYLNDLNAMHAAALTLPIWFDGPYTGTRFHFEQELIRLEHPVWATAAQRAEAFLKTIGKWEEAA